MAEQMSATAVTVRQVVQGLFLVALVAWVIDLPGRIGLAVYGEQYLLAAAGMAVALALLAPPPPTTPRSTMGVLADLGLAGSLLAAFGVASLHYPLLERELATAPAHAVALGVAMILGVLEAVRRRTGLFLPGLLLVLVFVVLVLGPELPRVLATRPVGPDRLAVYLALDTNGLPSRLLHVAVVTIGPFILFGALLNGMGVGLVLTRLMTRLVGGAPGGTAKAAVLGSAGFGLVSGSAVANVTTVGAISIPMMQRAGYPRHEAAAIEAVASTGGQLLPPLMGAAAFLMAEFLEVPYREVAIAALVPGLLFYAALYLAVDFAARRHDARPGAPAAAARSTPTGPPQPWRYLIAVAVLLHLLFVEGRSPQQAGLWATVALIACHLSWPLHGFGQRVRDTGRQLLEATTTMADIVVLAAAAALVVGVLTVSGLAFALTLQMVLLSGGLLLPLLLLAAALSMILGMGMPTVAVYVLLSTLAAPALIELGTTPMAAHLYLQYFGMLSMITPPIAIASFAAASVAEADPWRTAFRAVRLSAAVYAIPFAFVTQPELLLAGDLSATALAVARCLVAIGLVTAATIGGIARPLGWGWRLTALALALPNLVGFGWVLADAVLLAAFPLGLALLALIARPPAAMARRAAP